MLADVRFGSKADLAARFAMSALPPIADIDRNTADVRFVPEADIWQTGSRPVTTTITQVTIDSFAAIF